MPSEEDDNYILYRPSKNLIGLINPAVASKIASLLKENRSSLNISNQQNDLDLSFLLKKGFIDAATEKENNDIKNKNQGHKPQKIPFSPHETTLDITKKCNMKCIYCYACGGDDNTTMNIDCAKSAIDFCIANAKRKGIFLGLHFHGAGEPSQEFDLLSNIIAYAEKKCKSEKIQMKSSIITNGLISSEIANYYFDKFDEITLSFDGNEDSHNLQRKNRGGNPTFNHVYKTGKILLNRINKFNIRVTITSKNLSNLQNIVSFFIEEFPKCSICIEPVTLVGRALDKNELACDPIEFADSLFQVMKTAIESQTVLYYSGVSGHSERKEFCAASAPSFCISAEGNVTSCFSYSNKDVVKDMFVYGHYDNKHKEFVFNNNKISELQSLTMEHDDYCFDCFCKSHCIGDCPAIRKFDLTNEAGFIESLDTDFMLNRRCATNRRIVKLLLNDIVRDRVYKHGLANNEMS